MIEAGFYSRRPANLADFVTTFFAPCLFHDERRAGVGCGATALALLTGVTPAIIAMENRSKHYRDKFMTRFLRRQHYRVLKLTMCTISTAKTEINNGHVVLLSQLFRKNEATWGVIHNGLYFHNFVIYSLDSLSMLNKPVLSAYVVVHERWTRCVSFSHYTTLNEYLARFPARRAEMGPQ